MDQLAFSGLREQAAALRRGELTSVELVQLYLDRIARHDRKAGAYVDVYSESALLQAQAADLQRRAGLPLPALHGLPIALKDLTEIAGRVTMAGSRTRAGLRSAVTGAVYERLAAAGMILLGKLHTTEFAFGSWGTNPLMGTPRNPWDWSGRHRATGGSSSGAGAAVAGGLAPAAIGSDTGGSIRIPAAFNGLTGLKTTRGLISVFGHVALAPSFDTVGTLTHSADDARMLLDALAGCDPRDPATLKQPPPAATTERPDDIRRARIAVMPREQYPWAVEDCVQDATDRAEAVLASQGLRVERVAIPFDFDEMMRSHSMIAVAEAYSFHGKVCEDPDAPVNSFIRKRVLSGREVTAEEYLRAQRIRHEKIAEFNAWMRSWDAILTPNLPAPAIPLEDIGDEDRNPFTASANVAFNRAAPYLDGCSLALPGGFSPDNLPVGFQLIGTSWNEGLLLAIGSTFQQETDWHRRRPDGLDDPGYPPRPSA